MNLAANASRAFNWASLAPTYFRGILSTRTPVDQQRHEKHTARDRLEELGVPERPRRPLTPYFRFVADRRPELQRTDPNLSVVDAVRRCAADWSNQSDASKQRYVDAYASDVSAYRARIAAYEAQLSADQRAAIEAAAAERRDARTLRRARKERREAGKPRRPPTPFMQFLVDEARRTGRRLGELMSADAKGKWADVDAAQRKRYVEVYEKSRAEYEKALLAWEMRMLAEGREDLVRRATLREVTSSPPLKVKDAAPSKPTSKPSKSSKPQHTSSP